MKWFRLALCLLIAVSAVGFMATAGNADTNGGDMANACTCDANAGDPPPDGNPPPPDPAPNPCDTNS